MNLPPAKLGIHFILGGEIFQFVQLRFQTDHRIQLACNRPKSSAITFDFALGEVEKNPKVLFDALLIDEAQDLPREFLRLAYLCTRDHRIIWAYDDLQNLGDYQMRSLRETFGEDAGGHALVTLTNQPKQPRQDIILPKCYRNTPWALVTAHALGSGIYRDPKMVQHPDDPVLWGEIGYEVIKGELKLGQHVALKRSADSAPKFFQDLLKADDAVQFHYFNDEREQFAHFMKTKSHGGDAMRN